MTDEQHGHYIRALMMANRLIGDGEDARDWRLSFGRLFEGRRESPIPEDVGTEVEYVLRSRIEAARLAIGWALTQNSRRSLETALAVLSGDDTRVDLRLLQSALNRSEPLLNRSEPGVVQGAVLSAQSLRQVLEALQIGLMAAHEVAERYHAEMREYRGDMLRLHDDREQQVLEALKLVMAVTNRPAEIEGVPV